MDIGRNEPNWISEDLIQNLHDRIIEEFGGKPGVREQLLIGSALTRPQNSFYYEDNDDIFDLAAIYSHGIAKNHAFFDGNKRTAFAAADIFLSLNGYQLNEKYEMVYVDALEKIASERMERKSLRDIYNNCAVPTHSVASEPVVNNEETPAITGSSLPVVRHHFDFARIAKSKRLEVANTPVDLPQEIQLLSREIS